MLLLKSAHTGRYMKIRPTVIITYCAVDMGLRRYNSNTTFKDLFFKTIHKL